MGCITGDDTDVQRWLDRGEEREPYRARRLPRRPMAVRARLADIMCGALDVEDAGVLQPPVPIGGGS